MSASSRTSNFRGVHKPRNKDIYEAHVYKKPVGIVGSTQGTFDTEEEAAKAHDLVSLKYWGSEARTNFPISDYKEEMEVMSNMTEYEIEASIKRCSSRFSAGSSPYRGVSRKGKGERWVANKGNGTGSVTFLGVYHTEEEAAMAYDIASILLKGFKAQTNFDIKLYDVKAIIERGAVHVDRETAKRLKEATNLWPNLKNKKKKTELKKPEERKQSFLKDGGESSSIRWACIELNKEPWDQGESTGVQESRAQGTTGFRHSSASCFRPYTRSQN
ncbi:hypothetical protein LguiA_024618 [Lonicera macranthoides]